MQSDFHQIDPMSPESYAVAIAVLRERHEVLGREMRELKEGHRELREEMRRSQEAINKKLDEVLDVMAEARGGWKTLMLIGGLFATLGAGLAWLVDHFRNTS